MTGETFGAMLRLHRTSAGLSQNQLAHRAGVDPSYINRMERGGERMKGGGLIGHHLPRRTIVCALAQILGLGDGGTDRLLYLAGLAPSTDWQTRAERAELKLALIGDMLTADEDVEPKLLRRTG